MCCILFMHWRTLNCYFSETLNTSVPWCSTHLRVHWQQNHSFTPLWNMTPVWSFPSCLSWTDPFFHGSVIRKTIALNLLRPIWLEHLHLGCVYTYLYIIYWPDRIILFTLCFLMWLDIYVTLALSEQIEGAVCHVMCVMWCKEVCVVLPQALFSFMFAVFFKLWKCAF